MGAPPRPRPPPNPPPNPPPRPPPPVRLPVIVSASPSRENCPPPPPRPPWPASAAVGTTARRLVLKAINTRFRRSGNDRAEAGAEGHQLSVNPYAAKVSRSSAFHLPEDFGIPGAEQKE